MGFRGFGGDEIDSAVKIVTAEEIIDFASQLTPSPCTSLGSLQDGVNWVGCASGCTAAAKAECGSCANRFPADRTSQAPPAPTT